MSDIKLRWDGYRCAHNQKLSVTFGFVIICTGLWLTNSAYSQKLVNINVESNCWVSLKWTGTQPKQANIVLPILGNSVIKDYDAYIIYPSEFDSTGKPVQNDETGIGVYVSLLVSLKSDKEWILKGMVDYCELNGWAPFTIQDTTLFLPIFRHRSFVFDKQLNEEKWCFLNLSSDFVEETRTTNFSFYIKITRTNNVQRSH